MEKAFENQIKTIEDQGQKQIKSIQDQGQIKAIKKLDDDDDDEDTPFISKQKEIFNELVDEKLEKITDLNKKVNSDDLIYRYKGNTADIDFNESVNAFDIIDKIRDGKMDLSDVKNNQEKFKSDPGKIKTVKKSKAQKNTLYNIEMLYRAKHEAIKFDDNYSSMMSEGKYRATKGKGLKILTSKQMLQILPIALAQVKADNNSERLLNEIRKTVYSLYQSKKSLKKYTIT